MFLITSFCFAEELSLIPYPKSVVQKEGAFTFSNGMRIKVTDKNFLNPINLYKEYMSSNFNIDLNTNKFRGNIIVERSDKFGEEGYFLSVADKQIKIKGNSAGIFYAFKTLEQLIELNNDNVQIPNCEIVDEPRFKHRGLMLDVGRYYYSVNYVKQFLEIMSQYKLNRFHWHLTEDQGWRIEIKKYPELTKRAAWRNSSQIHRDKTQDNIPHGGFYSQEEVKEIVKYALDRQIIIIPEIEMPGHCMAALSVYPELSCTGVIPSKNEWGIFPDIYCAGNEKTFNFLEEVLTEIIELFPSEYIHIGGDEAPKPRWEKCPKCQKRITDESLKDEHELQSYFVQRIEKFLNSKGRKIIGWDEILEGGLAPNATVMSWRGEKGGIAAAKTGHDAIMVPSNFLYLDFYQAKDRSIEPYCHSGNLPLEVVYSYEPYPSELSESEREHIIGLQGNLWTEYINSEFKANYMLYPRALAVSEIAWTDAKHKNYQSFSRRIAKSLHKLERNKIAFRIPEPIVTKIINSDKTVKINLRSLVENSEIYYTVDGTNPALNGIKYEEAITYYTNEKKPLKCVVRLSSGRESTNYTIIDTN